MLESSCCVRLAALAALVMPGLTGTACSSGSRARETPDVTEDAKGEADTPRSSGDGTGTHDSNADQLQPADADSGSDADAAHVGDAGADSDVDGLETAETVAPLPPGPALLLDFEMRNPISWSFLLDTVKGLGHQITYRRWYPHVTTHDLGNDPETGKPRYSILIVSAGNGPSEPSERMRLSDAQRLADWLASGGTLLLLVRHTWLDGYGGDAEWLLFNRVLEQAGAPIRIARNTAVGFVSQPSGGKPPLHQAHPAAYPGSLEWTLNYPLAYPDDKHPAMAEIGGAWPAGVTATLQCDGNDVAALAWTHKNILLWQKLDNAPDAVEIPLVAQPLVLVAPAGKGMVMVAPRSLAQLPVHTEYMSDKPVLDLEQLHRAEATATATLAHLSALSRDRSVHVAAPCHVPAPGGLLSASGKALPPLGSGPEVMALFPPSNRPVPEIPPAPPPGAPVLAETPAPPSQGEAVTPNWYPSGRARFGYGGYKPYEEMLPFLEKAAENGIDSFVVTVDPAWLSARHQYGVPSPEIEGLAKAAAETGTRIFLGVNFLLPKYGDLAEQVGAAIGADGQEIKAPPPISKTYWDEALLPVFLGGAELAAEHEGIAGIHLDTELYGAGQLWYSQGFMFDPATWDFLISKVSALDPALAQAAADVPQFERLAWLVDNGLAGLAMTALETQVAALASDLRLAVRTVNPDVELAFYGVMLSTAWFYRGLMKGLGTMEQPVTHLSYDVFTLRARKILSGEGIHIRVLGGLLGVLFKPADMGNALLNLGTEGDGYWLFQFTDFPVDWDPANPPKMHGTPDDYWAAVKAANEALGLLPAP
jgi:hypothetical protein